jgi:hypothetical protein
MSTEVVATFESPGPAQAAAARLEAEGIPTVVQGAHLLGRATPMFGQATGRVRLCVSTVHAEDARALLNADAPGDEA